MNLKKEVMAVMFSRIMIMALWQHWVCLFVCLIMAMLMAVFCWRECWKELRRICGKRAESARACFCWYQAGLIFERRYFVANLRRCVYCYQDKNQKLQYIHVLCWMPAEASSEIHLPVYYCENKPGCVFLDLPFALNFRWCDFWCFVLQVIPVLFGVGLFGFLYFGLRMFLLLELGL